MSSKSLRYEMFIHPQELSQIQAHITKTLRPNFVNTLLRTLTLSKTPEKVLPIYNQMLLSPSHHDHFTFTFALKACTFLTSSLIQKGQEVHARALKSGHLSDLFVQNSLLAFYSASFDADACRTVFSEILSPDVVSWTSLVSAFAKNGCPGEALLAFASMDVEPNEMTLVSVLSACSRLKDGKLGKILHGFCVRRFGGHGGNVILDNALLDMYLDCGAFTDASELFDFMPHIDVVSGTTMICGYVQHGRYEEAIAIFVELVRDGEIVPNELTVACVSGACASAGILRLGKWVHSYSLRSGFDVDGIVGNALIHMYSKCGAIGAALWIFGGLLCRDLASWCTIMRGMATNGKPKHAIQLFALMLCYGVQPDNVAFLAVMSACCHAGLIEEGLMFFREMHEVYGILPEKEHFTCIIDTYGRAACLKEAEDFFIGMPMKPDKCVWGALLSACKIHGADEVVYQRIQKRVLHEGMTLGGGTYALLSNMLANAEKWDESNIVRKLLNTKKISKLAGYSWTELA